MAVLILWGSEIGNAVLGELGERYCPVCGKVTKFQATVRYAHTHIWHIFSWINDREYAAVCAECQYRMPIDKDETKRRFPKDTIPFEYKWGWLFVVLLLLAILSGVLYASSKTESRIAARLEACLAAPKLEDIYCAELSKIPDSGYSKEKNAYGLIRLDGIDGDKLLFLSSSRAYTQKRSAYNIGMLDFDKDNPLISLSRQEVQDMVKQGIIYEVRLSKTPAP